MNVWCFFNTHVQRGALLVCFYAFALSLLNAKAIVALIYNISLAFSFVSSTHDENSVVSTAHRVFILYVQAAPESRGLVYLNILVASICCLLLAHGVREHRPTHYWPFFGLCIYKMLHCSSELLESTMIIMHKVPFLSLSQQAATIHFIMIVGVALILILFLWAYFLDITYRSKKYMERELLNPPLYLPTVLSSQTTGEEARPTNRTNIPPPPFDWKLGEPLGSLNSIPPAYQS
ncbi:hypothetical protein M3Y94_00871700 [Aphelenchoides besseyi]|nr:hypothetical protein M3Y94_00871700 [Aphelenchoides besseyi]KAI6226642.1 hypothetical protein M3Y95_00642100 [Aphelenchoides besseyi]